MHKSVIIIFIFLIPFLLFADGNLKAGIGYTRLSNRFVLFEEDTLWESNQGKFILEGNLYRQFWNQDFDLFAIIAPGNESFMGRSKLKWLSNNDPNLKISGETGIDLRLPYQKNTESGVIKPYIAARLKRDWEEAIGGIKIHHENKQYYGESSYNYDYNLSKLKVDLGFEVLGNDNLNLAYQFAFRYAPDSLEANYQRNDFYIYWFWLIKNHYLQLNFDSERRVYYRTDKGGSYRRNYFELYPRISLSRKLTLIPKFRYENYIYDNQTEVYSNRNLYIAELSGEWAFNYYLTAGIGPNLLLSESDENNEFDNYSELAIEFSTDYLKYKKLWLDITLESGLRVYKYEPPEEYSYYSNFLFVEFSAFATYWITPRLRFDFITSYSPEWHDIENDDITIFYLSTNLKYDLIK